MNRWRFYVTYEAFISACALLVAGTLAALGCSDGSETSPSDATTASGAGAGGAGGSMGVGGAGGSMGVGGAFTGSGTGGNTGCFDAPPTPAGPEAVFAPEYADIYKVYDLGPVPGMPSGHLGGCVIQHDDPDTLLLAGDSETQTGAIYSIGVERGPCGHIIGWKGTASLVATTPHVDANLVYAPGHVLFYTQWPVNKISELLPGASQASVTIDGASIGIVNSGSVSGFGFVPPSLGAAGEPRTVTWANGDWYHLAMTPSGATFNLSGGVKMTTLTGGPGGFAYIPAGSPGFNVQSIILAEWSVNKVATYEVDALGDPLPATRSEFFTTFPRPWGAYFEPGTGDFLFLTWGSLPDRVYVVQGFAVPPPIPR